MNVLGTALALIATLCALTATDATAQDPGPAESTPTTDGDDRDPFAPPPPGDPASEAATTDRIFLRDGSILEGHVRGYRNEALQITNVVLGEVDVPPASVARISLAFERILYYQAERGGESRAIVLTVGSDGALAFREVNSAETKPLDFSAVHRIAPDPIPIATWVGSIGVTSSLLFGNTEEISVGVTTNLTRETAIDLLEFRFEFNFLETTDESGDTDVTKRAFDGQATYRYFFEPEWGTLLSSAVRKDALAGVDLRYTANAGLSARILQSSPDRLIFDLGATFTFETLNGVEDEFFGAFLGVDWFSQIERRLALGIRSSFVVDFSDLDNFRVEARVELAVTISGPLALSLVAENRFDHRPAPGFRKDDTRIVGVLSYRFGD